jgi:DNA repair protein RadC
MNAPPPKNKTQTNQTPADAKGHRARMRQKLLEKGSHSLTELEILEMLLYGGAPRGDTKPLAKRLMKRFDSLSAVLRADTSSLRSVTGIGDAVISALKIAEAAGLHISHARVKGKQILTHWMGVQKYCINKLAHEPVEHVMVLCLDSQNRLIADETLSRGTVNQTAVYPREVVNLALRHFAQAVIIVHNHPGAEMHPSRADIDVTRDIAAALGVMDIKLHDHLIVAGTDCVSFKSLGHLWAGAPPHRGPFLRMVSAAFRVISPARRLARSSDGRAFSRAFPATSPAFLCTAGFCAARINAPITKRRISI